MEFKITDFENGKVNIGELLDVLLPSNRPSVEKLARILYPDCVCGSVRNLANYLYTILDDMDAHYETFTIKKRNGKPRLITKPDTALADIQKRILRYVLQDVPVAECAGAYVKGKSLRTATAGHIGYPVLLKLDIRAFFESVTFVSVRQVFEKLGYDKYQCITLARLCCYHGRLPQGTATSPMLSNLVMADFDCEMSAYCQQRGIVYTRYSDDMLFSGDFDPQRVVDFANALLSSNGFQMNKSKMKVVGNGQRQVALGVVLNEKQQVPKSYRQKIRQEIYYCRKYTVKSHLEHSGDKRFIRKDGMPDYAGYLNHLLGRINFALQINPEDAEMLRYQGAVRELMRSMDVVDAAVQDALYDCALAYYTDATQRESLQTVLEKAGFTRRDLQKSRLFIHEHNALHQKLAHGYPVLATHDDLGNTLGLVAFDYRDRICRQVMHPFHDGFYGDRFQSELGCLMVTSQKELPLTAGVPNLVSFHNMPEHFFLSPAKRQMLERFGNTVVVLDCPYADLLKMVFLDAGIRVL